MTENHKANKIVDIQRRIHEHDGERHSSFDPKEARSKLFRGEISIQEYYRQVHLNRRGPCPNCGQYHN